ncbi:TonB-dependent receptor [Oleiharenicola lentus]|uniref:TonB-dependent receptor n=1 Tax=Oleiharenicola lentus TaxID=2508720 RepID=UPI003F671D39
MTFRFRSLFKSPRGLSLVALLSASLWTPPRVVAAPMPFDIPAQPAPAALQLFIKQSGQEVLFSYDELKSATSYPVKGEHEPLAALSVLLRDTGCAASAQTDGRFLVTRSAAVSTGSVKGTVVKPELGSSAGIRILLRETGQQAITDRRGDFVFTKIDAGTYTLIATAEGLQPMHITEVRVRAGRELTLSRESMRVAGNVTELEPFVVRGRADEVTELDKYVVEGKKQKPFVGGNVDLPRTVNDVQPYYVFDAQMIDRSAALNVEDFLKQRLTMNTTMRTGAETVSSGINVNSAINLRGLGADRTLVMVNGRRLATRAANSQTDINGIPLSAIDRIEVLPSSSSGIYGGSAIGGVINIILKKNYSGGEIRASYDNTWDTDSPRRTLSLTWGQTLGDGKTHVMFTASASDTQPLLFQDRIGLRDRWQDTIQANVPDYYLNDSFAPLASTPNIKAQGAGPLVLLDGRSLGSTITHVSAGLSPTASLAEVTADLLKNAGSYNLQRADTAQWDALKQRWGSNPESKAIQGSIRRQMLPSVEIFSDFSYSNYSAESVYNPFGNLQTQVPAGAPGNPFRQSISIRLPNPVVATQVSQSLSRAFTIGALVQLPGDWIAEFDYTWSDNRYRTRSFTYDSTALSDHIRNGVINVISDTVLYPYSSDPYFAPSIAEGSSQLDDFSLRSSGSLPVLPWGSPTLTVIGQHRISTFPDRVSSTIYPTTKSSDTITNTFRREQATDSAAAESLIPLLKREKWPLLHSLDLQLAGRMERYEVDTGTPSSTFRPSTGVTTYGAPNINGQPFKARTSYQSRNGTIGLRYQPIESVTFRTSVATAFLPPTPAQLLRNPEQSVTPTTIDDRVTGGRYGVFTIGGGNPDLKPENSKSWNAGVIWQPRKRLDGMRANLEYYKITQFDKISTLTVQQVIDSEDIYGDRVTRDASGLVTLVDISSVNLFKYETDGFDLSVDYRRNTPLGILNVRVAHTYVLNEERQLVYNGPSYDYAGYVGEGGPSKHKGNASVVWERRGLSAGWTTTYFGSYKISGAAGGPTALRSGVQTANIIRQGGDTIPTQVVHDLFFGYRFDGNVSPGNTLAKKVKAGLFRNLTVQAGVKNVFNAWPEYDASSYQSPYIDVRLRSYWVSVRKQF